MKNSKQQPHILAKTWLVSLLLSKSIATSGVVSNLLHNRSTKFPRVKLTCSGLDAAKDAEGILGN